MTDDLRQALRDRVDDLVGPRTDPPPFEAAPRVTHRTWLAVAAAVLLVAAVAVVIAVTRRTPTARGSAAEHPPPGYITSGQPDPHRQQTIAAVRGLLDQQPMPPGARRLSSAPVASLGSPQYSLGEGDTSVHLTAWWTAPGSVADAVAFFRAHVTSGLHDRGSGPPSSSVKTLMYAGDDSAATAFPTTFLDVAPDGHSVAMRLDAYAMWRPSRTTDTFLAAPSSVVASVTVQRTGRYPRTVRRALGARQALDLARAVNASSGALVYGHSCGNQYVQVSFSLRFATHDGTFVVATENQICNDNDTVTTPDGRIHLIDPGNILGTLFHALGLPKDFIIR